MKQDPLSREHFALNQRLILQQQVLAQWVESPVRLSPQVLDQLLARLL